MNILFLSNLSGNLWTGPNNSVPAQIAAQKEQDNIFWFNLRCKVPATWTERKLPFLTSKEISSARLANLPAPFNHPDIVVVEEVYPHRFSRIIADVQKAHIPYIIIPRSQLTRQGQQRKLLKKWLGNLIYHKQLVRRAAAVQYLTKQEQVDSGAKWNKNSFVLPNGINLPDLPAKNFSSDKIQAVYIGRLEKYQKGLDILLEACRQIQGKLRAAHFTLTLYGPNHSNSMASLLPLIKQYQLEDILFFKPSVFGKEKEAVLRKADVFVMTSRFEGHPMGLIEALAYGLPCVATAGTNMREEIEKYDAGWTADTTAESIAAALEKMLAQRAQFAEKSANARRLAEQYDWTEIAKQSHQIYEEIIKGKK